MEELSTKKKGWKRGHIAAQNSSLLDDPIPQGAKLKPAEVLPKNMMEFGRDWRRLDSHMECIEYLHRLGIAKFKRIIKNADDFELLESLLRFLTTVEMEGNLLDAGKWMKALAAMSQYSMLLDCVDAQLREDVGGILRRHKESKKLKEEEVSPTADNEESNSATAVGTSTPLDAANELD